MAQKRKIMKKLKSKTE